MDSRFGSLIEGRITKNKEQEKESFNRTSDSPPAFDSALCVRYEADSW
jgi:hypothetical protein